MPEKQKDISSEKEQSTEQNGSAIENNQVEVSSLKKLLGKGTIGKLSKLKRDKNTGETSVSVVEDKAITVSAGSTEVTVEDGKNSINSETSGLTIKRGKNLSGSIGLTSIVGEDGKGKVPKKGGGLLGITIKKEF